MRLRVGRCQGMGQWFCTVSRPALWTTFTAALLLFLLCYLVLLAPLPHAAWSSLAENGRVLWGMQAGVSDGPVQNSDEAADWTQTRTRNTAPIGAPPGTDMLLAWESGSCVPLSTNLLKAQRHVPSVTQGWALSLSEAPGAQLHPSPPAARSSGTRVGLQEGCAAHEYIDLEDVAFSAGGELALLLALLHAAMRFRQDGGIRPLARACLRCSSSSSPDPPDPQMRRS